MPPLAFCSPDEMIEEISYVLKNWPFQVFDGTRSQPLDIHLPSESMFLSIDRRHGYIHISEEMLEGSVDLRSLDIGLDTVDVFQSSIGVD